MTTINYTADKTMPTTEVIQVTKKEGKKRVPVGEVKVYVPTLADLGIDYAEGDLIGEWADRALRAAALSDARNKLVSGTASLKAGAKIAETLAEIAAPAENSGAALREIAEFKKGFAAYLDGLGLSEKAKQFLTGIVASPKSAALQPPAIMEKVVARLEGYLETLEDGALTATQERYLTSLIEQDEDKEEFDLDDL